MLFDSFIGMTSRVVILPALQSKPHVWCLFCSIQTVCQYASRAEDKLDRHLIRATILCDPWDASRPTLEITGTKYLDPSNFCNWPSFFCWELREAYSASPDLLAELKGEGKKSRKGNGWNMGEAITGDGDGKEGKDGGKWLDIHPSWGPLQRFGLRSAWLFIIRLKCRCQHRLCTFLSFPLLHVEVGIEGM